MAHYVDGFAIPIKKKNVKAYKKMAQMGCKTWMKHGALSYYECIADDFGKYGMGFKKMCKLKAGETAVFAYVVYKSKAHRNTVFKKVMNDPRVQNSMEGDDMPFDGMRMYWGGFKPVVKF